MISPAATEATLPRELRALMFLSRRLPPIPRATGIVNRCLKPWYLRRERKNVVADVLGSRMLLSPAECVDGGLLFYPHLYDRQEIAFLRRTLRRGDVFLDIGSNIGFYALVASRLVGPAGRVVAIEADPVNFQRLAINLELNAAENVVGLNYGVSDRAESLSLGLNTTGNRGGNSFLREGDHSITVNCLPLADLVRDAGVERIRGAKLDIEGFEFRVLRQFFQDVETCLYPEFLIVERNETMIADAGGDVAKLLSEHGYRVASRHRENCIMVRGREADIPVAALNETPALR